MTMGKEDDVVQPKSTKSINSTPAVTNPLDENKTPPRSSLACESTPIASIKRPRNAQNSNLSPMHSVKPVSRTIVEKVDGFFSPVATFLEHDSSDEDDMSMSAPEHPVDADEFNPWMFIRNLPDYHNEMPVIQHLGECKKPKTLVLDLDETLVHCSVEPPASCDLTFPVTFHGTLYTVHVKLRPFLMEFLKSVQDYEVIVFTASQKVYADTLLDKIDPEKKYIQHRLFRESCLNIEGNYLKDLNVLGRDLKSTILVDNSPHAFGYQLNNGVPIESWFEDPDDKELLKLSRLLKRLYKEDDVRPTIRDKFESYKLVESSPKYS